MTNQSHRTAKLAVGDKTLELPIYSGTIGPDVDRHPPALLRRRRLHLRPRLSPRPAPARARSPTSTATRASCSTAATRSSSSPRNRHFLEVAYLLLYGELPTAAQLEDFVSRVTNHTMLHEQMAYFFRGFRRDAHPMAIVCGMMGAMAAFYHDSTDITDAWQREVATIRMIAKMPTIVAWAYKYSVGQPFVYPKNSLDYASNFLNMCFSVPAEDYVVNPILPARWTGSSRCTPTTSRTPRPRRCGSPPPRAPTPSPASPPASPASGVRRMAAPTRPASDAARDRHGRPHPGIHQARQGQGRSLPADGLRPPRLQELRPARQGDEGVAPTRCSACSASRTTRRCRSPRNSSGSRSRTRTSSTRSSIPNVDFYSGIILDAIGFPTSMFTPIFALARTVGWISQWKEMLEDPQLKIGRPRQLYTGPTQRDYVDVEDR